MATAAHKDSAHHIEEFGSAGDVVHHTKPAHDGVSGVVSVSHLGTQAKRLRKRLFRHHNLQQHFAGSTLYRTMDMRKITNDELFLDLIIVANIAVIGHELRDTFEGWVQVEKFLLLFGAVYSVWRGLVFYWNLWESNQDMYDKLFVYAVFTTLTGIGIGAHGAFTTCLPWVAGASFVGNLVPWGLSAYHSKNEALLSGNDNVVNNGLLMSAVQMFGSLPYFAACFVKSERAAKILFWIPPLFQLFSSFIAMELFRFLHRNHPHRTSFALSIELFVEKFEVLTLIVLGESLLAILFEAALYVTKDGARINILYGSVFCATAIVCCLAAFYMNIDGRILRGSKHAVRYNRFLALTWSIIHLPYHICLVLFATGLGIAFRDIIIKPKAAEVAGTVIAAAIRATAPATDKPAGPEFGTTQRWLFTAGWGGALVLSGAISCCHSLGPRDFTKRARLLFRFIVAVGLSVGLPFAELGAAQFVLIFAAVSFVVALAEYILVNADSVNLLRHYKRKKKQDLNGGENENDFFRDSLDDDEDTDEEDAGTEEAEREEEVPASPDLEAQRARMSECPAWRACRARQKLKGRNRLVAVNTE